MLATSLKLILTSGALLFLCGSVSVNAATNGSVQIPGTLANTPATCAESQLDFTFGVTPTTDDLGGYDYVALVTVDADGMPLDADFLSYFVAGVAGTPAAIGALGLITSVGARPVTLALFVILASRAILYDSMDGYTFAVCVIFLAETSLDQA